ncbi:MAG TPA: chromate efflux transporter [Wenzhouxiangella sp.]|nr:chromate efflux transporter [Wenzhouxiangella sp.]
MANGQAISTRDFLSVWWQVAILSFGGPAAQIGVMQRLLVDERGWLSQARFNHALNFCLLLPGPEAQQLATYIGWLLKGVKGGLLAGILFVLPGALIMLGLSLLYVTVGRTGWVEGLLFGLQCAVFAIVAQALITMASKVLDGAMARALAAAAFVAMFFWNLPFPLVVATAGFVGWRLLSDGGQPDIIDATPARVARRVPVLVLSAWVLPLAGVALAFGVDSIWARIAGFFSLLSTLSFGGAYAVLAWVAQYASEEQNWLTATEMLDGLGLAETTPGPLILVTQFVGFLAAWREHGALNPLLAGSLGAGLTTWMMFLPSFFWIFLMAPWVERLRHHQGAAAALRGITAAVVGVIANLAVWFALRLLFAETRAIEAMGMKLSLPVWATIDPVALVLCLASAGLLFCTRLSLFGVVGLAALAGWLVAAGPLSTYY